jgi:type I restriction enzyme R subunit
MKSANFEIIRGKWPELAELGGFAEAYAHADPASALVKLRQFAENLTKDIHRDLRLPKPYQPTFVDLLKNEAFSSITPKVVLDKLHALRIHGNKARTGRRPNRKTLSGCSKKRTISRAGSSCSMAMQRLTTSQRTSSR